MATKTFRIICASNASTDIYPNNTLSKFTNLFSLPLDLTDGNWHVALQSLCFHARFMRRPGGVRMKALLVHMLEIDAFLGGSDVLYIAPLAKKQRLHNRGYYHETPQREFIKVTSRSLPCITIFLTDEHNAQIRLAVGQPTFVELVFTNMTDSAHIIRFSSAMSLKYYPNNSNSNFSALLPTPLPSGEWKAALSSIHFPALRAAEYIGNLPIAVLLYADIVAPTIIGSKYVKMLKLFPYAQNRWNERGSFECNHLAFIPVEQTYIGNIKFTILDAAGEELKFAEDEPTFVTVVFKKIK